MTTQASGAAHTPWRIIPGVYDTNPETACEFPHGPEIVDEQGVSVAYLNLHGEALAELIIRAVNSHADLVAALEEMVADEAEWFQVHPDENDKKSGDRYRARWMKRARARAALAKAGQGEPG